MNPSEYDKMFELEDHYWWFVARRRLALDLLRRALPPKTGPVLDLGCGTGVVSRELTEFARPISLDMSEQAMAYCQRRGLTECVRADGSQLPLQTERFAGVLGLDIFEHIEDDLAAFRESFRVLAPGGVLVLSVPAFTFLWGPHDVALHHFRRYRRSEVRRKLQSVGFSVERCSYSVFLLFPLVILSRVLEKLKSGPARASLPQVPPWLNALLIRLQAIEADLILHPRVDLPWGSSVIAVARRPRDPAVPQMPPEARR